MEIKGTKIGGSGGIGRFGLFIGGQEGDKKGQREVKGQGRRGSVGKGMGDESFWKLEGPIIWRWEIGE